MTRGLDKRFLDAMRLKLEHGSKMGRTAYENHWDGSPCDLTFLSKRLSEEVAELLLTIMKNDPDEILYEAADVANFAMMIADLSRPEE